MALIFLTYRTDYVASWEGNTGEVLSRLQEPPKGSGRVKKRTHLRVYPAATMERGFA
jgi:hypothetical protein